MIEFRPGTSCEVCGASTTNLRQCPMCSAYICPNCMPTNEQLCPTCQEAKCYICEEYLSSRACDKCGLLVCEDHGSKRGEATLCDVCRTSSK